MKTRNYIGKLIIATTAALAAATGTLQVQGQNINVDNFDTAAAGVSFWADSWGTGSTLTFGTNINSPLKNSAGGSGSLRVESAAFTGAGGWEQAVIEKSFSPALKASLYTSVSVDIRVDPTSSPKANGQYGLFELKYGGGATAYPGSVQLPSSATNWMTVTFTIPGAAPDVDILRFQLGDGDFTGKIIYYIDNLRYNAPKTYVNRFDETTEVDVWFPHWGTASILTFDATDAGGSGNPASGSLKVTVPADYFTPENNGWEQMVIRGVFNAPIVGADHTAINFDVKADPSSVLDTDGNYGYFEPKTESGAAIGGANLANTNWINITYNFAPNAADLAGILFQNGNSTFQGPVTYYLDNISFVQRVGGPVLALVTGPLDDMRRDEVVLNWVLNDGAFPVDTASVVLKLDGVNAPSGNVTVTKTGTGATVDFAETPGNLWASGVHTWNLTFKDTTTTNSVTGNGTFIVNPFPTDGTFVIEAEDWNYGAGLYNPSNGVAGLDVNVMPYYGNAYDTLSSVAGVDYVGDDGNDSDLYRTELDGTGGNAVNIGNNLSGRYGTDRGTYAVTTNYRFGWVANGEWHNYTRVFPATNYTVWAALSRDGRDPGLLSASLDLVTSPATTTGQTVSRLGQFDGPGSGGWGRNTLVPMKTAAGAIAVYKMGGEQTVRFNVGGGDFDFFLFVPTGDPLSPPIITGAKLAGGNITVTWFNGGTLWKSPSPAGPWTTTSDSDGSYTESATTGSRFFQAIRVTP